MKTRKQRRLGKGLSALILSITMFAAMVFLQLASVPAYAADDTVSVSTLENLQTALADDNVKTVIVTETIFLPDGTNLDGKGKIIQVEKPYMDSTGVTNSSYSCYNVFTITNGCNVTINNVTIYGGGYYYSLDYYAGGIINNGTLTLTNSTITRANRGLYIGSGAKAVLKNSNIVRNVHNFGGGILCDGGILVMDGCSLSENRSTGSGGGAMEIKNKGYLYANNTVIANNSSNECGGAINAYKTSVYIMNSTIVGNVTTNSADCGAGFGLNGGNIHAVNCLLQNNYYISGGTGSPVLSDAGARNNSTGNVLINCLYGGTIPGQTSSNLTLTDCQVVTDDSAFLNYRTEGIIYLYSSTTTAFKHPTLISRSGVSGALYAPVNADCTAVSQGTATYFDYSDLSNVKMSYMNASGQITALTASGA